MTRIAVALRASTEYRVTVEEGGTRSEHEVTVTPEQRSRYSPEGVSAERLVEASFEFLLEHEPKESILRRFDLGTIETYFPEYPRRIREKL